MILVHIQVGIHRHLNRTLIAFQSVEAGAYVGWERSVEGYAGIKIFFALMRILAGPAAGCAGALGAEFG